jgi:hypothetical protein
MDQIQQLRQRVAYLRIARILATEYQMSAPKGVRGPLAQFVRWLEEQESKATEFGKQLVEQGENQ